MHTSKSNLNGNYGDEIKQIAGKVGTKEKVLAHLMDPKTFIIAGTVYCVALTDPINIMKSPVSTLLFGSVSGSVGYFVATAIKDRAVIPLRVFPFISGLLYLSSIHRFSYALINKIRDDYETAKTERKIRDIILEEETRREKHIREIYRQEEEHRNQNKPKN